MGPVARRGGGGGGRGGGRGAPGGRGGGRGGPGGRGAGRGGGPGGRGGGRGGGGRGGGGRGGRGRGGRGGRASEAAPRRDAPDVDSDGSVSDDDAAFIAEHSSELGFLARLGAPNSRAVEGAGEKKRKRREDAAAAEAETDDDDATSDGEVSAGSDGEDDDGAADWERLRSAGSAATGTGAGAGAGAASAPPGKPRLTGKAGAWVEEQRKLREAEEAARERAALALAMKVPGLRVIDDFGPSKKNERNEEEEQGEEEEGDEIVAATEDATDSDSEASASPMVSESESEDEDDADAAFGSVPAAPRRATLAERAMAVEAGKHDLAQTATRILASPERNLPALRSMVEAAGHMTGGLGQAAAEPVDPALARLAALSCAAVFCDILPSFRIRTDADETGAGAHLLSKEVAALRGYENGLLRAYQSYLQTLQAAIEGLRRSYQQQRNGKGQRGGSDKVSGSSGASRDLDAAPPSSDVGASLTSRLAARTALRCMCRLVVARPGFNYAQDLVRAIVQGLGSHDAELSTQAAAALRDLLKSPEADERAPQLLTSAVELSADLVRRRDCRVPPALGEALLGLSFAAFKDSRDADAAREARRKRLGRKARKSRDEVDRAFAEAQAIGDQEARRGAQSARLEALFEMYFRVLKHANAGIYKEKVNKALYDDDDDDDEEERQGGGEGERRREEAQGNGEGKGKSREARRNKGKKKKNGANGADDAPTKGKDDDPYGLRASLSLAASSASSSTPSSAHAPKSAPFSSSSSSASQEQLPLLSAMPFSRFLGRYPLLPSTLEGLARFSHLVSIEYFGDLISEIRLIIEAPSAPLAARVAALKAAVRILSGQGEALPVDRRDLVRATYSLLERVSIADVAERDDDGDEEDGEEGGQGSNKGQGAGETSDASAKGRAGASGLSSAASLASLSEPSSSPPEPPSHTLLASLTPLLLEWKLLDAPRAAAFVKKLAAHAAHAADAGTAAGALWLAARALRRTPRLRGALEHEGLGPASSGTFDPAARDPTDARALDAPLWELCALATSTHPVVARAAKSLLEGDFALADAFPPAASPLDVAEAYSTPLGLFKPAPKRPKAGGGEGRGRGRAAARRRGAGAHTTPEEAEREEVGAEARLLAWTPEQLARTGLPNAFLAMKQMLGKSAAEKEREGADEQATLAEALVEPFRAAQAKRADARLAKELARLQRAAKAIQAAKETWETEQRKEKNKNKNKMERKKEKHPEKERVHKAKADKANKTKADKANKTSSESDKANKKKKTRVA